MILILYLVFSIILVLLIINCFNKDKFYNIIDTNYKTYYFNNRGFAQSCDKKLDVIGSDSDMYFDKNKFNNLKDFDKVFLTTNMFKKFIKEVNIDKKIIIILGCSVTGFPREFSQKDKINYLNIIESNNNIISLYTQNYDLKQKHSKIKPIHSKIKPIPLGIDYHYLSNKLLPIKQEEQLISIYNNSLPFENRLDLCYSFFQFQMFDRHNRDRHKAKEVLDKINFNIYQENKIEREETWKNMVKYKWIISPHGNGLDCHRTYEAIALGCIPVVKSSTLDIMYKDMPIIILNDWNEISLELLKSKTEEALKKSKQTITLNYWINKDKIYSFYKKIPTNLININNNTVLLFTFCVDIGRHSKKDLINALKLQLKFIKINLPNYFIICFTNFNINDNFSGYNINFRDYYDKSDFKLYNDKWLNLSFNKINIYKDLYDEFIKDFIWIDLDTLIVYDISYINKLDNLFLEQGTKDISLKTIFTNNNDIKIKSSNYIQGDFWKLNINLYNDLISILKELLKQKLKLRYDLQDLFNYYIYIKHKGDINKIGINILGNNIFSNTVNGLSIWNNTKIQHPNINGLNNLFIENNKIKTKLYPNKQIHILSFTFFTLNNLYNNKKFKHIFLN